MLAPEADIKGSLAKAFALVGINDWNSVFWVCHPEVKLGQTSDKLKAIRQVLNGYRSLISAWDKEKLCRKRIGHHRRTGMGNPLWVRPRYYGGDRRAVEHVQLGWAKSKWELYESMILVDVFSQVLINLILINLPLFFLVNNLIIIIIHTVHWRL